MPRLTRLLLVFLSGLALSMSAASLPNILFILVDDMGYGDPGCYNPKSRIATPHIDRLAREGLRFTDAHSAGALCHPSRYGLLTGQHPFRADVNAWRTRPTIVEERPTIASVLGRAGYHTAMVGKWHLGFAENGYDQPLPGGPVDRGFDSFLGIRASTDIPPYFYIRNRMAVQPPTRHIEANNTEGWSPIQGAFWRSGGIAPDLKLQDVLPRFTDEAIQVIQRRARVDDDRPLFLYLAFPAPHTPWLPAAEFLGKSPAGLYGDFMVMVDAMIGRVLEALRTAGMEGNTLVLFSSDNGPTWYEEDVQRLGHDSAGGWRGMKSDAWEAGHRIPFIVRWPGKVRPCTESAQLLCFTDMLATFAEIAGMDLEADATRDSTSMLPVFLGRQPEDQPLRRTLVVPSGNGTMTIRSGPWKLINGLGSGGFSKPARIRPEPDGPQGQLYHLARDPGETDNLWLKEPEVVKRLQDELAAIQR